MKSTFTKTPAVIAMCISVLVAIGLGVMMFLIFLENTFMHQGMVLAWITFDLIFFILSLFLYAIDAVLSVIKSCMKIAPTFNIALSSTIFCEIIVTFIMFFSTMLKSTSLVFWLWGLLYLAIFILEILSIAQHIKGDL